MSFSERDQRDFQNAVGLHQSGQLPAAIEIYSKIVKRSPKLAIVLNLLGLAEFQTGQLESAAKHLGKALALDPRIQDIHYNLATVLQRLGRFEDALPHFEKAIAAKPNDADAHINFGIALKSLGRNDEALREYERALALNPKHAGAYLNLGNLLAAQGREAEAVAHLEKSIALYPRNSDAYVSLGNVLRDLERAQESLMYFDRAITLNPNVAEVYACKGVALASLKRYDEAAGHFLRATQIKPDFAEAFVELGNALRSMNRLEEALIFFDKAIQLKPDFVEAYRNKGICLEDLDRHEESFAPLQKAVQLKPGFAEAITSLAGYYFHKQDYEEAEVLLERSRAINPSLPSTHLLSASLHAVFDRDEMARAEIEKAFATADFDEIEKSWNLGYLSLSLADWTKGWDLYEKRFSRGHKAPAFRDYAVPLWRGEKIQGKLVAWAEQGLGDQILYASMIPDLQPFADELVVECSTRLIPLFQRSFPGAIITPVDLETLFDGKNITAHTPLVSAGKYLRTRDADFPKRERGYLRADELRIESLRRHLVKNASLAIGLSWRSANAAVGEIKSARLVDFEPVLNFPGTRFVDLQYGDTSKDRDEVKSKFGIDVAPHPEIDNTNDIDGLAALVSACDAVVTTSNTTAHLSGALGRPTWVLLPFGHARFWYWLKRRSDSIWYPEVTLIRQERNEPWKSVVERAAADIRHSLGGPAA